MTILLRAHLIGAFVLTGVCAVGGVWSAYCWARKQKPGRVLEAWYLLSYVVVYLQVTFGALLYSRGLRPKDATHVLYGITPAVVILVLISSKKSIQPRRAAVMTVALLAFGGMGVRGIMTGFA
jgi:heme A synthase